MRPKQLLAATDSFFVYQIIVCTAIAWLYSSIGMNRKFAYYIREAAILQHKLYRSSTAHRLFLLVAPHYQLSCVAGVPGDGIPSSSSSFLSSADICTKRLLDSLSREEGWLALQISLLKALIETSYSLSGTARLLASLFLPFFLQATSLTRVFRRPEQYGHIHRSSPAETAAG